MKGRSIVLYSLVSFALLETIVVIVEVLTQLTAGSGATSLNTLATTLGGPLNPFVAYAPPISVAGWIAVGLVVLQGRVSRGSKIKSLFLRRGFAPDIYNLMMGMRGGGSRMSLLQNMETPKHRLELSELTGIDWKEVDRQLSVLEKYGLVKIQAQSGTVKMYQVTEQGKLLLNLVAELNK